MSETLSPLWQDLLARANQAAANPHLGDLLQATLALLADASAAQGGALLIRDLSTQELVCLAVQGSGFTAIPPGTRLPTDRGAAGAALHAAQATWLEAGTLGLPLHAGGQPIGAVLLFEAQPDRLEMTALLCQRMSTEIARAAELQAVRDHNQRLQAMIDIFGKIGSTLDRDHILRMMIDYARQMINAEACSLFLVDTTTQEIVLHLASPEDVRMEDKAVRVPAGKGIIGHVVASGEAVLVPDVSRDDRHYRQVDQAIGFITRALLAVPLRSRSVALGQERGLIHERVIGGFEAVNKMQGTFDTDDATLLTTLANQAATVLQIADLYSEANDLFLDLVSALTTAIDAKDPYTEGHSQRVSDFSVEIARQLGLAAEVVHQVRIGSLLHDVGKIGIPDQILCKPGRLTDEEFAVMKQHPVVGANIMGQVRKLHSQLPAIAEHHERLDGSGYPLGLRGDECSLLGRIVAVADVFDALTSNRPYRGPMPVEEVLDYLFQRAGRQFDEQCVHALAQGYIKGIVKTQPERLIG